MAMFWLILSSEESALCDHYNMLWSGNKCMELQQVYNLKGKQQHNAATTTYLFHDQKYLGHPDS